jgi:hypothetical protein
MKKPRPDGGVFRIGGGEISIARVDLKPPERGLFSTMLPCKDSRSSRDDDRPPRACQRAESLQLQACSRTARDDGGVLPKKKPDSREPGLRYWPREADTITFQEGLLNARAAGGGGQMRNANAQRKHSMIPAGALQQLGCEHVSHAETGGFSRT